MTDAVWHCEVDEPSLWDLITAWLKSRRTKAGAPTTFREAPHV